MPARHCACSALCLLGTFTKVPARRCACSAPPRLPPAKFSRMSQPDKKKTGGRFGVEPHAHVKPCEKTCKLFHVSCKKTSCSTCHAKKRASCSTCHAKTQAVPRVMQTTCHAKTVQNRAKNKLFHMSCKNHAKCGAYGAPTRRTLTVPRVLAIRAICAISHKAAH